MTRSIRNVFDLSNDRVGRNHRIEAGIGGSSRKSLQSAILNCVLETHLQTLAAMRFG